MSDVGMEVQEQVGDDAASTSDASEEVTSQESAAPVEGIFDIDGQPITLDEARRGYLRQADYTRKTQEIAEQRKALEMAQTIQNALDANPEATLKALAESYGIQFGGTPVDEDVYVDPETQRIEQLEARVMAQEQAAIQKRITNELSTLHDKFGEFDDNELFVYAMKGNYTSLTEAYKSKTFDDVYGRLTETQRKMNGETQREQAKADAQVVQGGSGVRGGVAIPEQKMMDTREAFLAAVKQHGG